MNNAYARKSRRNGFLSTATPRRYEKDSDPSVATHVNVPSNRDRGGSDLTGAGAVSFNGIATTFNTRSKSRSSPGPTVGLSRSVHGRAMLSFKSGNPISSSPRSRAGIRGEVIRRAAKKNAVPGVISLDKYMRCRVYQESGLCIRSHCGAEPPCDIEPPGIVPTVGGRD